MLGTEFDLEDRVRVKDIGCSRDGMEGTIVVIFPSILCGILLIKVDFGNNQFGQFRENEIEKIL